MSQEAAHPCHCQPGHLTLFWLNEAGSSVLAVDPWIPGSLDPGSLAPYFSMQDVPRITPSHTLIRSPKYTRMLVEFVTCLDTAARQGKISIKFLLSPITIIIDI